MESLSIKNKNNRSVFSVIYQGLQDMYGLFVAPNESLISDEYLSIMKNKSDKEEYLKAVDTAREEKKDIPVTLSNGETLIVGA